MKNKCGSPYFVPLSFGTLTIQHPLFISFHVAPDREEAWVRWSDPLLRGPHSHARAGAGWQLWIPRTVDWGPLSLTTRPRHGWRRLLKTWWLEQGRILRRYKSLLRHSVKDSRLSEDTDLYHFFHTLVTKAGHRMTPIHRERVPWNTGAGSPLPSELKTLNR